VRAGGHDSGTAQRRERHLVAVDGAVARGRVRRPRQRGGRGGDPARDETGDGRRDRDGRSLERRRHGLPGGVATDGTDGRAMARAGGQRAHDEGGDVGADGLRCAIDDDLVGVHRREGGAGVGDPREGRRTRLDGAGHERGRGQRSAGVERVDRLGAGDGEVEAVEVGDVVGPRRADVAGAGDDVDAADGRVRREVRGERWLGRTGRWCARRRCSRAAGWGWTAGRWGRRPGSRTPHHRRSR